MTDHDDALPAIYEEKVARQSRALHTESILAQETFLEDMCDHIANGGSAIDFCECHKEIRYSDFIKWINKDPDRKKQLTSAEEARVEWFVRKIIDELQAIGMSDVRGIYDADGTLLPPSRWPRDVVKSISGIETLEHYDKDGNVFQQTKKVRLWDKIKAIEMLGSQFGMFNKVKKIEGKITLEQLVAGSYKEEDKK